MSTHYNNFDSRSISITANSILSNVKNNKLKKVFDKCKVTHAYGNNVLHFLSCNSCNGNTTYTSKTVNFRHRMNNHITACRYGTFTNKFGYYVLKCSKRKEHVAKEPYFKVYVFMTVNNGIKLLYYK